MQVLHHSRDAQEVQGSTNSWSSLVFAGDEGYCQEAILPCMVGHRHHQKLWQDVEK